MRAHCTFSHWGTDGLKPYMRYTMAGGQQYSAENISGIGFCPPNPNRYIATSINANLDEAMAGLLTSPGHLRNVLNPHHRKVNIGISYRRPNLWLVQLFVGDYVGYTKSPTVTDGRLSFSGRAKNGANISGGNLNVTVSWEQTPHSLTRGQLHNTGCYSGGEPIAALNPFNAYSFYEIYGTICGDPYEVSPDAPAATSYFDRKSSTQNSFSTGVALIPTDIWKTEGDDFAVSADISNLLDQHGDGVYTTVLWAEVNGEDVPISEYSIFIPPYESAE